ncbi:hypothetical protein L2755_10675 [Shewanella abyssi]|uniref:hypothetical protein n=1 Tax=Shewanella abyssi TaxID=311789 RepID=UPI00200D9B2D|nr:hypothetical protein [Shewanella abyssi]MCL1050087.1 hypothetical protein [Shewanella abyssi]
MKNKLLFRVIVCSGLCLIGWLIFMNSNQTDISEHLSLAASSSQHDEVFIAEKATVAKINTSALKGQTPQLIKPPAAEPSKKSFDEEWCLANIELDPNDILLAESQVEDWNEYQGRASAKSYNAMDFDDESYPNNSFVASYQELPIEQLELLASGGDKWAMVTLLQSSYGNTKLIDEIANKLLVQGASYYALEYLVIRTLSTAKTNFRRTGDVQEATEHLVNALVYAQWGVDHYNVGGLTPYLAITSRDPFEGHIEANMLLVNSNEKVKQRYQALSKWIEGEQEKLGIIVQVPPKAAINDFAGTIAILRSMHPNRMTFISELGITDSDRFNTTPCVDINEARLAERLR